MRTLQSIVGVEAIVLVALLGIWWLRQDELTLPSTVHAGVPPASAPPGESVAANVDRNNAAATAVERRAVSVPEGGLAASQGIVLQGRFSGVTPLPAADSIRLSLRRGDAWRSADVSAGGVYAVSGLSPGSWQVRCEAPGCRLQEFPYVLSSAAMQRLDIELQAATVLTVFARTSDDKRLQAELAKLGVWQGLHVIATTAPLSGDLEPTENSAVGDFGVGRHRQDFDLNKRTDENANDGVLELDQPPPVYATLLVRHMAIAQQRIEPGQQELRFVVELATVAARFAKVRMRVIGPDGQPAAANAELASAQGGGQHGRADNQGVVAIDKVMPGLNSFSLQAKDCEQYSTHLTIAAGADLDLGDIVLSRSSALLGCVVDGDGPVTSASVQWTALDLWRPPHPLNDRRSTSCDGDGNFQLYGTGRRLYTVTARAKDGQVGFAIVDGSAPGTERFVVRVHKTHALRIRCAQPQVRVAVVSDVEGHVLMVRRLEHRWREGSCALPDGEYQLSIYDGYGTRLLHEPLRMAGSDIEKELQ
ncbi:MAG: carboxypeptidase regulatory-like domain-containing protein [Planctomycetes bacterium]|nr:carboxypeptidase regulatory-like domain-containing protein [Planctomycetota bacterium]